MYGGPYLEYPPSVLVGKTGIEPVRLSAHDPKS